MVETEKLQILNDFYQVHRFVTLTIYVMFVNGMEFMTTPSRKIRLITAEHVPIQTSKKLRRLWTKIDELYERGGFMVNIIFMDWEFDKFEDEVGLVEINTTTDRNMWEK